MWIFFLLVWGLKTVFWSTVRNLQMQVADCMQCSVPFYVRDLSIGGFCYLWRVLEPDPLGCWGMTVVMFWGSHKLMWIFDCTRISYPCCSRVNCTLTRWRNQLVWKLTRWHMSFPSAPNALMSLLFPGWDVCGKRDCDSNCCVFVVEPGIEARWGQEKVGELYFTHTDKRPDEFSLTFTLSRWWLKFPKFSESFFWRMLDVEFEISFFFFFFFLVLNSYFHISDSIIEFIK